MRKQKPNENYDKMEQTRKESMCVGADARTEKMREVNKGWKRKTKTSQISESYLFRAMLVIYVLYFFSFSLHFPFLKLKYTSKVFLHLFVRFFVDKMTE